MRYVSKPTECEAMQWRVGMRDTTTIQQAEQIVAWVNANGGEARYETETPRFRDQALAPPRIAVRTINGWAYAAPGHYVVMGTATFQVPPSADPWDGQPETPCRDFYPCDPETFERRWALDDPLGRRRQ